MFSRAGRITLAAASFLFGLMLMLWASDQEEMWKFGPATFCFAVFGATVLPAKAARWCGYFISLVVLYLCIYLAFDEFDGGSIEYLLGIGKIFLTFGIPALVFLTKGIAPFDFGADDELVANDYEPGETDRKV